MIFYKKLTMIILTSYIIQCQSQLNNFLTSANIQNNSYWNPMNWFSLKKDEENWNSSENYNPDTDLSTTELAIRYGYSAETHTVKTEDGYLLTVHRIPCGRSGCTNNTNKRGYGQPVFLQHGLLSSSADWLLSGPDRALGFILSDMGYDVWLGNARGNTYSKRHVRLSNEDSKFWEFSWHEMAFYDISAEIDYLYEIKNEEQGRSSVLPKNLLYIGHSMGTTMAFVLLSERPEYNNKIKAVFAMAPVAYMGNVKSPIRLLAPFSKDIEMIARFFGANEFLPQNKVLKFLAKYGCELTKTERYICENSVFVLCGFDKDQFNATLMPVIFGHTPAGTSTKTVIHYAQEIHQGGNFQQYDFGEDENLRRYGQRTPPIYNINNIQIPIYLFYSVNDWLAGPQDVLLFHNKLNHTISEMYQIPYASFNHVDFLWGNNATTLVYAPLIEKMLHY